MPPQLTDHEKAILTSQALGPPVGPTIHTSPDGGPSPSHAVWGPPTAPNPRVLARLMLPSFGQLLANGNWTPQAVGQVLREALPPLVAYLGLAGAIEVLKALPDEIATLRPPA